MLTVSAGMVHAVPGKAVVSARATRSLPAGVDAAVLAGVINGADLESNAGRADVKGRVNNQLSALISSSGVTLGDIAAWCDTLVAGVTTENGKQLIADIIAMHVSLRKVVDFMASTPPGDVYDIATPLEAFKAALPKLVHDNGVFDDSLKHALQVRSDLDASVAAALTMLTTLIGTFDGALNTALPGMDKPRVSAWDELGELLNYTP